MLDFDGGHARPATNALVADALTGGLGLGPQLSAVSATPAQFIVHLDSSVPRDPIATGHLLGGLRLLGDRFAIVSANSRDTARTFCAKLHRAGLDVPESRVFLAGEQTLRLVGLRHPEARCLFAASRILTHAARRFGLVPVQREADVVVIGRDTSWNYQRLELIANEVARGAAFYATNRDTTMPTNDGRLLPDTGAMVVAVEAASGVCATSLVGAPPRELFALAASALGGDAVLLTSSGVAGCEMPTMPLPRSLQDWRDLTSQFGSRPSLMA
ncbi:hypothetical protein [Novosphingobium sp.]|uniref:hypothetical protein n=1 Tax=Novosphingobium sp. TaxID=1874826 RepID=UPI0038B9DA0F